MTRSLKSLGSSGPSKNRVHAVSSSAETSRKIRAWRQRAIYAQKQERTLHSKSSTYLLTILKRMLHSLGDHGPLGPILRWLQSCGSLSPAVTQTERLFAQTIYSFIPSLYPFPNDVSSISTRILFFFFNYHLFIYLFMAVLGLRFCARAFPSCGKRGPLFIAVRTQASHYRGLSCCGAQAPDAQAQ